MNKSYRDLSKGTASYYARYRYQFPAKFFRHLVERCGLDGQGCLLDLGCGTGQLAIPLAAYFHEVIGLDPEPEMLEQAALEAENTGATNIRWVEGGSADLADLQDKLGTFRLVTIGNSFHWMDQAATLKKLDELVDPGGGLVITGASSGSLFTEAPDTEGWQTTLQQLLRKWLGETRQAGSSTYRPPDELFEQILARSPFSKVELFEMEDLRYLNIQDIIGLLYSTSYSSKAVLGGNQVGFEQEVRETLLKLNPSDKFTEQVHIETLLAWRPT